MHNEHSSTAYFDACIHANNVLGSDAAARFDELRKLSRSHSLEELRREIDRWAKAPAKPTPTPRGLGSAVSDYKRNLCAIAGGQRLCKDCVRKGISLEKIQAARAEQEADLAAKVAAVKAAAEVTESEELKNVAGTIARAQEMWLKHRRFVRKRIHGELTKYPLGNQFNYFDDLEAEVWKNVARDIDSYHDRGLKHGPLAWLREVTRTTLSNYFRDACRKKRDIRKTFLMDDADSLGPQFSKPRAAPDEDANDGEVEWQAAIAREEA